MNFRMVLKKPFYTPLEVSIVRIPKPVLYTRCNEVMFFVPVGSSVSVTSDLKYLFESHENFSLFPTFAIIPATIAILSSDQIAKAIPNKNFDLSQVINTVSLSQEILKNIFF